MTTDEANKVDLTKVAEIEVGGAVIRVTWVDSSREFIDGGAAVRLLERWRLVKGAVR